MVISPVDGQVWMISQQVQREAAFEIKGEQYYLTDLLAEDASSPLLQPFVDGLAVQIVLMPFNYHRWHTPVTGKIKKVRTVPGYFFAQPAPNQDYAASFPFLSHVNTRTIVFIEPENPAIGEIAVIFVGLTEVSSCTATVGKATRCSEETRSATSRSAGRPAASCSTGSKIASLSITDNASLSDGASGSGEKLANVVMVRQNIGVAL